MAKSADATSDAPTPKSVVPYTNANTGMPTPQAPLVFLRSVDDEVPPPLISLVIASRSCKRIPLHVELAFLLPLLRFLSLSSIFQVPSFLPGSCGSASKVASSGFSSFRFKLLILLSSLCSSILALWIFMSPIRSSNSYRILFLVICLSSFPLSFDSA